MNLSSQDIRMRDGAAVWREIDGEIILLATESSTYLRLNRTAAVLWPLVVVGTSSRAMEEQLIAAYAVDRVTAQHDIARFLALCEIHDLLVRSI